MLATQKRLEEVERKGCCNCPGVRRWGPSTGMHRRRERYYRDPGGGPQKGVLRLLSSSATMLCPIHTNFPELLTLPYPTWPSYAVHKIVAQWKSISQGWCPLPGSQIIQHLLKDYGFLVSTKWKAHVSSIFVSPKCTLCICIAERQLSIECGGLNSDL